MLSSYPAPTDAHKSDALTRPLWVDLLQPTSDEIARVEAELGLKVPSRQQLDEIEASSRLRAEGKLLYLSTPLSAQGDASDAVPTPVGFVLSPDLLVTIRYVELKAFANVRDRIAQDRQGFTSTSIFATLLEEMVDVGADLLENIANELGSVSRRVFRSGTRGTRRGPRLNRQLREMLTIVGDSGEHLSQMRESLTGLQRIIGFTVDTAGKWLQQDTQARLQTGRQDLTSLADFEAHLSGKAQFLLDAILGLINTDQNDIFNVLTIVSVVGIPPTLIASMYGMNFHNMPELSWPWGYQYGLTLIALSTIAPILWFKWRGWW